MSKPSERKTRLQKLRERIKNWQKKRKERWKHFVCWVIYGHSHKPMTMSVSYCHFCGKELLGSEP